MLPEPLSVETRNGDHRALESRTRMISLRLTEEEYERFRTLCVSRGLRNVSEMVRSAVNQLLAYSHSPEAVSIQSHIEGETSDRLTVVEARLSQLEAWVSRVPSQAHSKANGQP